MGVERAGGGQRTHPGFLWRVLGELGQGVESAGGHDLTGGVAVGRDQLEIVERASTTASSPPSTAAMPVGSAAQALAISAPRVAAKRDGVVGGDDTGHGVGGDLTDGVSGDRRLGSGEQAAVLQFPVCQQSRGDDKWLCHGGVGDFLGRRGGTEPGQVQTR